MFSRRQLGLGAAGLAIAACAKTQSSSASETQIAAEFSDTEWAKLTEAQWKDRLSAMEFAVLRQEDTERPGTSPLNDEKRDGTFVCAGCELPLFNSETKYDSGTGWPSFYDYIDGSLGMKEDKKLWATRTEYHCARCGGHQGHVFEDGPKPTSLRYCNNGVALNFVPA